MTYQIRYMHGDGSWQADTTGTYDTLEDAEGAMRLAEVIFPRVSHKIVELTATVSLSSGRRATTGRLTGSTRVGHRG